MRDYIALARPQQWYKNIVIFIAIFFAGKLFHPAPLIFSIMGFLSLCFISSANYALNDVMDRKEDRKHPEKKHRPVASGRISILNALVFSALLVAVSLGLGFLLGLYFVFSVIALFIFTLIYSAGLKKEPIVDIIIIGINFVIRAIAGAFAVNVKISPWLVACTFFLALLLASTKRKGEIELLGKKSDKKSPLKYYKGFVDNIINASATILIISYTLYSFIEHTQIFMATLPVFVYGVFSFMLISCRKTSVARNPHLVFMEKNIVWSGLIFLILLMVIMYV